MKKVMILFLLSPTVLLMGFSATAIGIDDIVLKITKITYGPHALTYGQSILVQGATSSDEMTFERIDVELTNTGTADFTINFKNSFLTDNADNMYSLSDMMGQTNRTIKPGKTKKFTLYYEFPEAETPKFLIIQNKVFEAKVE